MKADLHVHTKISDCSFSFAEILDMAEQVKVTHLAITNHDTTNGLEEMVDRGARRGMEIIPGIEISAYDFQRKRRIHILGYYVQPGHAALKALCDPIVERRHQASALVVDKLMEAGFQISWERVMKLAEGGTGVYKQHIMHALIENGYTDSIYGPLYKKLFSRGENGESPGIAYVPMEYVDAVSAIQAIKRAGGVPVLAHAGQYRSFDAVPELVRGGLEGIEVWHPLHGRDEEERARAIAGLYDLLMTGGSDFHGFYGEKEVTLGSKNPGPDNLEALKAKAGQI